LAVIVSGPQIGIATVDAETGNILYQAPVGFGGTVTFTYRAEDGAASSRVAVVTITVVRRNSPPTATDAFYMIDRLDVLHGDLRQFTSDAEGDALQVRLVSGPQDG